MTAFSFHDRLPKPIQLIGQLSTEKTPESLAQRILDGFPTTIWNNKDKRWLCPVSKSGIFELEIFRRLMIGLAEEIVDPSVRRSWIIREMIYSFALTPACELFIRRNYLGKAWDDIEAYLKLEGNIFRQDFLAVRMNEKGEVMIREKNGKERYVKFDCVVGNPPYQNNSKANDPKNIYPDFVLKAMDCNSEYMSMIIPARWMMGSGKKSATFLETMLQSKKLVSMTVEKDATKIFPGVEIKGGVMYFLCDQNHNSYLTSINGVTTNLQDEDVIIDDILGVIIKSKVLSKSSMMFSDMMLGSCPFEIRSTHKEWAKTANNSYICHTSGKGMSAKTMFISKTLVKRNTEYISKYKVCIATASGSGSDGTNFPFILGPDHIVSQSYLVMSCFDTEQEAINAKLFLSAKLAQYLISLLKNTQNIAKRVFKYLPYLDFTRGYSDQDLYTMFDLSVEEIKHIEETTKDFPIFRAKKYKEQTAAKTIDASIASI